MDGRYETSSQMKERKNMRTHIPFPLIFLAAAVTLGLVAANAAAQSAPGKDSAVLSPEAAKRTLTKGEISAEVAEKMAHVCEDFATKHGYSGVIYITDTFGDLVHVHRMDGTRPVQLDGAITKAKTALFYRANTHE